MERERKINGFGFLGVIILAAVILSVAFGGGMYWKESQKQQSLLQTGADAKKRAEELKQQIESRQSIYGGRTATQNYTAYNSERSFGGYNMGDSVFLYWYVVPNDASKIRLYRSSSAQGPWIQIRDYPVDVLKYGPVDSVDGTKADIYYKAEAISLSETVLKEYGVLRVPKYVDEYGDLKSSKNDTSTWKTYRNEKYGFLIRYPSEWRLQLADYQIFFTSPAVRFFTQTTSFDIYVDAPAVGFQDPDRNVIKEVSIQFGATSGVKRILKNLQYNDYWIEASLSGPRHNYFISSDSADNEESLDVYDDILTSFEILK